MPQIKNKKSFLHFKLVLFGLSLVGALGFGSTEAFNDISSEDRFLPMYQHVRDLGIMAAPDNLFSPDRLITRAEALTIAMRAGGKDTPEDFGGDTGYIDVDPNQWYAPVIAAAKNQRIIISKREQFFPDSPASKAEFLAFLFRSTGVDFGPFFTRTHGVAEDVPSDSWFAPHFAYAKKYQIAHLPADQMYRPSKVMTRQEAAIMTYRQLRIVNGDEQTLLLIELQAHIDQFLVLIRQQQANEAEFQLHKIMELNDRITRTKNNADAHAAKALSKAMNHLTDSLRSVRYNKRLKAIESLLLAHKQAQNAAEKSENMKPFASQMSSLISEMVYSIQGGNSFAYRP